MMKHAAPPKDAAMDGPLSLAQSIDLFGDSGRGRECIYIREVVAGGGFSPRGGGLDLWLCCCMRQRKRRGDSLNPWISSGLVIGRRGSNVSTPPGDISRGRSILDVYSVNLASV